ncbi:MAG: hypothetical protein ACRYFX_22970 [Janthinobacterium lividum]
MRLLLKILLITGASLAALALALVGWFYISGELNIRRAAKDAITETARCDSTRYVTEQPTVKLVGFARADIKELHFYRLAGHKIVQDTLVSRPYNENEYAYQRMPIPFVRFLKSDTIVVETRNKRYFKLAGYHHYAYLHYGMFGYLGSSDCRLSDDCVINGKASENGQLVAAEGLKKCVLPR